MPSILQITEERAAFLFQKTGEENHKMQHKQNNRKGESFDE